jgi:hypothetical protein
VRPVGLARNASFARKAKRAAGRKAGKPKSRFYLVAQRIARRFEPPVAAAFIAAVKRLQNQIDLATLESAVASGNVNLILAAVAGGGDLESIMEAARLARLFQATATATGAASAEILTGVTGLTATFNAIDPSVVMYARTQAGLLIRAVSEDVREAVRIVVATAQVQGITTKGQARAIREVVGLPPNWVNAPLNLGKELRAGTFTESRRLSAVDKTRIRSRLKRGTVDEPFIQEMQKRYADSLINRRAKNIARTETLRSSNFGMRTSWRQAVKDGVLPPTAKRVWVVTPDDRLRETHARVPGMNPGGVQLEGGAYQTPLGPSSGPPLEPNCRCSEGLIFPGLTGVL